MPFWRGAREELQSEQERLEKKSEADRKRREKAAQAPKAKAAPKARARNSAPARAVPGPGSRKDSPVVPLAWPPPAEGVAGGRSIPEITRVLAEARGIRLTHDLRG